MNNRVKLSVGILLLAAVSVVALPALVSAQNSGSPSADGAKKIGIVDRKKVMESYTKFQAETKKLEADLKTNQAALDALENEVKTLRDQYKANEASLSDADKALKEQDINGKAIKWRSDFERMQAEMDSKFGILVKNAKDEIDTVIQEIGRTENYDMILEGDPQSSSGVLYYAGNIDMTSKVVDRMNTAK